MRSLSVVLIALFITHAPDALASDTLSVVDIRRNIPLADDEPVIRDFYITGPSVNGLKKDLVVTAIRKVTIRDANGSQAYGDIEIPVGHLRVLAVFNQIAVAREFRLLPRDEHPMLEQIGIMSGDRITLQGSFMDSKKAPKRSAVEPIKETSAEPITEVAKKPEEPSRDPATASTGEAAATNL